MYKQIWNYGGEAFLVKSVTKYMHYDGRIYDVPLDEFYEEIEVFEYDDTFTDIQPLDGLYTPIRFDGEQWHGTPYDEWLKNNPPEYLD